MVVIRCTQRLLKRSRVVPDPTPPESDALLGEWYANVMALPFRGQSAVIYGNVATRIVVITRGSTLRTTMQPFAERLERLLERLGAPPEAIALQRARMVDGVIATTNDRSMLGSMNDIAHMIRASAERHQSIDSFDFDLMEDRLAEVPHIGPGIDPEAALATTLERAGFTLRPINGERRRPQPATTASAWVGPPPARHLAPPPARQRETHHVPQRSPQESAIMPAPTSPLMIVATLTVRRRLLEVFREYERNAVRIMARHGGSLERSIVVDDGDAETLREVHVLRFPSSEAFDAYRADPQLALLATIRAESIIRTDLVLGGEGPRYAL